MQGDLELARLRAAMDVVNRRLAAVLHDRARLVRAIGLWKQQRGLPVVDPDREEAMLAELLQQVPAGGFPATALTRILRAVFDVSRELAAAGPGEPARG